MLRTAQDSAVAADSDNDVGSPRGVLYLLEGDEALVLEVRTEPAAYADVNACPVEYIAGPEPSRRLVSDVQA